MVLKKDIPKKFYIPHIKILITKNCFLSKDKMYNCNLFCFLYPFKYCVGNIIFRFENCIALSTVHLFLYHNYLYEKYACIGSKVATTQRENFG